MTQSIIKPLSDKKQYRFSELNNGLRILLISEPIMHENSSRHEDKSEDNTEEDDEQCRLAAAALCVGAGSFLDPENVQGLAHFLEHMLFMGSEKYPTENHLDDYLKSHSGHSNAFTEGEQTVYYFAVAQEHLQGALDIFGSCLIKPLLLVDASDREVKAVHSEYEDNLLADSSRRLQLLGMLAKSGHPFRGFPFGNIESLIDIPHRLGIDVNAQLRTFFQEHYTADHMYLAIQSHHSLDVMESWLDIYSQIPSSPNRTISVPREKWIFPFVKETYSKLYRVCPARDMHEMIITWALPPLLEKYLQKPHHYVSHLIGDESEGSLISFLRKKRLALQIVAGNDESDDEHNNLWCKFTVDIHLTDEGLEKYEEVLRYFFSYLAMLRAMGPQERIFNELRHINQFRFDYQDENEAVDNVNYMCQYLRLYPVKHTLCGSFVFSEWRPDGIGDCLALLNSDCNIILSSKKFDSLVSEAADMEPWFKTKYICEDFNSKWWSDISSEDWKMFSLPPPNKFIPEDFTVTDIADEPVKQLAVDGDQTGSRCWYKPGTKEFSQPKACVYLVLFGDVFCKSLSNRTAADIYLALLQFYLVEKLYPATLSGLKCSIKLPEFNKFGISIRFSGFSDKLSALIDLVLKEIVSFTFTEDMFDIITAEIERDYKNSCVLPMDFAHQIRLATLLNDYYSKFQRIAPHSASCFYAMDDFNKFLKDWRSSNSCLLDCFISGNVAENEALAIFTGCRKLLGPLLCSSLEAPMKEKELIDKYQCSIVAGASSYPAPVICAERFTVKDDDNFAVISYYQLGSADFKTYCLCQLYELIVAEPCFNVLRTQKQLGYNCFFEMHNTSGTLGFSVTVQSSHTQFNPKYVDDEIDAFMQSTVGYISSLSSQEFEDHVSALIELKLAPFGSLQAEARYYWAEICNHGGRMMDRREKEAEFLETVKQDEIVSFAKHLMALHRKISVQVIDPAEAAETFTNADANKKSNELMLCFPKAYATNDRFISDFDALKLSQSYLPHVEI